MQYKDTEYDIYEDGRCFSHKTSKFLKPQLSQKYPSYNLTINGKKRKVKVHRMVAETFLPRIEGKELVNHIDGNTKNFNLNNLEWVNAKENSQHAVNMQLLPPNRSQIPIFVNNIYDDEIWKEIKDYPNYLVSNYGRIINKNNKRLLRQNSAKGFGYQEVNLWTSGKGKTLRVHKIVYTTFYDDYDLKGYVINHKDGNKINNHIDNLEKVSYQENNLHAEYVIKTHNCAKKVGKYSQDGILLETFESITQATKKTKINCISRAIKLNYNAGGYKWKFI